MPNKNEATLENEALGNDMIAAEIAYSVHAQRMEKLSDFLENARQAGCYVMFSPHNQEEVGIIKPFMEADGTIIDGIRQVREGKLIGEAITFNMNDGVTAELEAFMGHPISDPMVNVYKSHDVALTYAGNHNASNNTVKVKEQSLSIQDDMQTKPQNNGGSIFDNIIPQLKETENRKELDNTFDRQNENSRER